LIQPLFIESESARKPADLKEDNRL
jgi:hypothetical protein